MGVDPATLREAGQLDSPREIRKYDYDFVAIGSEPGGQKAAIAGTKLGKSVAVVERGSILGGISVNTGSDAFGIRCGRRLTASNRKRRY